MQKYLVTSAVTFALLGCGGGGGSSKTPAPVVKYFDIDFFDVDNVDVNDKANCQIFGYNGDATKKIIAYRSTPKDNYEIVIHDADGQHINSYNSDDIFNTSFRFRQDLVPDNGYISFVEFSRVGINHVSTFEKSLLPDSFAIYAEDRNKDFNTTSTCLATSKIDINPQETKYTAYIESPDLNDNNFFYSINKFNQASLNFSDCKVDSNACSGEEVTTFSRTKRPVMLTAYKRENSEVKNLFAFKFQQTNNLGTNNTIGGLGNKIMLETTDTIDNQWNLPTDVELSSAQLFINGQQYQAPYAYLWQPLTTDSNVGQYSYSARIPSEDYYLKLQGQSNNAQMPNWSFSYVAQPNITQSLTVNKILDDFPPAASPELVVGRCQTDSRKQCIQVANNSLNNTVQRVFISGKLKNDSNQSIRQVLYTPAQAEIPVMMFDKKSTDGGFTELEKPSISLLNTESSAVIDAFLYQHQDLYNITTSDQLTNSQIDYIPLLKNLAAQQEQQDLLKRQPYTWVWLEENNG